MSKLSVTDFNVPKTFSMSIRPMKVDIMFLVNQLQIVGEGFIHYSLFIYTLKQSSDKPYDMHACAAKVPNSCENDIDHIARLTGKVYGKTRILSCNCYTLKQYLDKVNNPDFSKSSFQK